MEQYGTPQQGGPIRRLTYHIIPAQEGGWQVEQEGALRPYSVHNSQSEAIDEGKRLAENHRPSSLVTYYEDYSAHQRNTYD